MRCVVNCCIYLVDPYIDEVFLFKGIEKPTKIMGECLFLCIKVTGSMHFPSFRVMIVTLVRFNSEFYKCGEFKGAHNV